MALISSDLDQKKTSQLVLKRIWFSMWLIGIAFSILILRLYALQVLRGEELSDKGEENFVQRIRIPHNRGIIYDRFGHILADNKARIDVQIKPAFLGTSSEAEATLYELAKILDLSPSEIEVIRNRAFAQKGLNRFQAITVKRDLSLQEVEIIESELSVFRLNGVSIVKNRKRYYPYRQVAAHLLGYVKEIDAPELDSERARGNPLSYLLGDLIGRDGIEHTHEKALRGEDGFEKVVVDAKGRRQRDVYIHQLIGGNRRLEPKPGHNVVLTIDMLLQKKAEALFFGEAGAILVLEVQSGKVLTLVSKPAFDPNLISGLLGKEIKAKLDANPLKPWINRVITGQYAPGSTFKVITALAALREKATSIKEKVHCPGFFRLGRGTWRCHKDSGHGSVNLISALKVSCDTYFYTMGGRVGIDAIATMSRWFRFGKQSGIELRNERPGLVPDEAFHDRVDYKTGGYQRGMAINTSIGQGALLVTPLQLAVAYAAIANNGIVYTPQIVERIETADFQVTRRFLPKMQSLHNREIKTKVGRTPSLENDNSFMAATQSQIGLRITGRAAETIQEFYTVGTELDLIDKSNLALVRDGLFAVANERGGTAYWRRSKKVSMAGKTGTAQVVRLGRERLKSEELEYFERDHAWFVAYAPAENPQIVVAVLNEHSGHGSSKAAPIAVGVIDAYIDLQELRKSQVLSFRSPLATGKSP